MKTASVLQQRQFPIKQVLFDLLHTQKLFWPSLRSVLDCPAFRSLQWSADGRHVCLNRACLSPELGCYLSLNELKFNDCYNWLISLFLQHNFCVLSDDYGNCHQIKFYYHANFFRDYLHQPQAHPSCHHYNPANFSPAASGSASLINSSSSLISCLPANEASQRLFKTGGQTNFPQYLPWSTPEINVPTSNYFTRRTVELWEDVRVVPLSFLCPSSWEKERNESQRIDDLSSETEDSTDASRVESHHDCDRVEDEHSEDEEDALPSDESMTSHRQMLDQFFDPRNKKKKIVTSWFKNRRINDRAGNEAWRSAVLISSKQRKRKQAKPPKPSKLIDPAIVENIALVKTFGEAYTKWREKRIKMKDAAISKQGRASSSKEHQSLQKLNYSSLYSANTAQEILEASRQSIQIENAVKSIEL